MPEAAEVCGKLPQSKAGHVLPQGNWPRFAGSSAEPSYIGSQEFVGRDLCRLTVWWQLRLLGSAPQQYLVTRLWHSGRLWPWPTSRHSHLWSRNLQSRLVLPLALTLVSQAARQHVYLWGLRLQSHPHPLAFTKTVSCYL